MWIERYSKAGEFTIVANADIGMRDKLPIGSLISHADTTEIMIVENHEIRDDRTKETEVVITGRGFEVFFEHRIVGSNKAFPTSNGVFDFAIAANYSWNQLVTLISEFILATNLLDDDNAVPYAEVLAQVSGTGDNVARSVKRGELYSRVLELLDIDDLGIKVVRPGPWSPLTAGSPNMAIVIHDGVDRTDTIMFSYDTGEIESADYLWSNKKLKNCAVVSGKWVETFVDTTAANYDRRMMLVDASDIDNSYSVAPVNPDLATIISAMQQRGIQALAAQKDIALTKAEVSKDTTQAAYRTDFNVGDLITVVGDYNETSSMRISEYVEIEDGNGKSGYPTLTMV